MVAALLLLAFLPAAVAGLGRQADGQCGQKPMGLPVLALCALLMLGQGAEFTAIAGVLVKGGLSSQRGQPASVDPVNVFSGQNVDTTRVDQIVQFALARAAQEDEWKLRELGPIHLIKYVYLADLAHARAHDGKTYTGVPWVFHHYGPWSPVVVERLEQAALAIGATVRTFESSKYDKDITRYALAPRDSDAVEHRLDRQLPVEVVGAVKQAVRMFANDTGGLLDWVYRTPPMLAAAPRDRLDFAVATREEPPFKATPPPELSRRQEKKLEAALENARQAFKQRLTALKAITPSPPKSAPPRYDETFAEGRAWLDAEAEVEPLKGEVHFPKDIWKSGWRDPHGGE